MGNGIGLILDCLYVIWPYKPFNKSSWSGVTLCLQILSNSFPIPPPHSTTAASAAATTTFASHTKSVVFSAQWCEKVKTAHPITTSFNSYVMLIAWLRMAKILLETVWGDLFYFIFEFRVCFFKVKHSAGHISGMFGPNDMKRKRSALAWYWAYYVNPPITPTHDLGIVLLKVKFRNSCNSGMFGVIDTGPTIWACPLIKPMNWPYNFNVNIGNSLISGLVHVERKVYESSIPDHKNDLCGVIMAGRTDVPHSDPGDFRHWCSIDISISGECWYSLCIHVLSWSLVKKCLCLQIYPSLLA